MNAEELRQKTADQLNVEMVSLYREHFNLRVQRATGQLASPARMRVVRRNIARIKTVLRERVT